MWLRSRTGLVATAVAMILIAIGLIWTVQRTKASKAKDLGVGWTPLPRRVQVEVLNAGRVPGAGRVAMLLLRHAGLDVVQSGNADSIFRGLERSRIVVRRGDTTGVGRIIEALGGADVIDAPDTTRLVDLSVFVGKNFAPPPDRVTANQ